MIVEMSNKTKNLHIYSSIYKKYFDVKVKNINKDAFFHAVIVRHNDELLYGVVDLEGNEIICLSNLWLLHTFVDKDNSWITQYSEDNDEKYYHLKRVDNKVEIVFETEDILKSKISLIEGVKDIVQLSTKVNGHEQYALYNMEREDVITKLVEGYTIQLDWDERIFANVKQRITVEQEDGYERFVCNLWYFIDKSGNLISDIYSDKGPGMLYKCKSNNRFDFYKKLEILIENIKEEFRLELRSIASNTDYVLTQVFENITFEEEKDIKAKIVKFKTNNGGQNE